MFKSRKKETQKESLQASSRAKITPSSSDAKPQQAEQKSIEVLEVTIHSATGLLACDKNGTSDPYVKLHMGKSANMWKSTVKSATLSPFWEEKFTLKCKNIGQNGEIDDQLNVVLLDYNRMGAATFMGHVVIPCQKIQPEVFQTETHSVIHPDKSGATAGTVKISIKRTTLVEKEGAVARAVRKKLFATVMLARLKMIEWKLEAEIECQVKFGIVKVLLAVGVEKGEQTIEEARIVYENALRDASNDPLDTELEPAEEKGNVRSAANPSKFNRTLSKSMSKLQSRIQAARTTLESSGLSGTIGAGLNFETTGIEIEIMLKVKVKRRNTQSAPTAGALVG